MTLNAADLIAAAQHQTHETSTSGDSTTNSGITIETNSMMPTATEQKQQRLLQGKSNAYAVDSRKYTLLKLRRPSSAPSYRKGSTVQAPTQSSAQKKRPTSATYRGNLTQPPPRMYVEPYPAEPYGDSSPSKPRRSPQLVMDFGKQLGHNLGNYITGRNITADLEYRPEESVDSSVKKPKGVSFDGQCGRDAVTAVIEANSVRMFDAVYEPNDSLTTKNESSLVQMDKTITRDQRVRGMARWNTIGIDPNLPWYDTQEVGRHIAAPHMAKASKRTTIFASAAEKGKGRDGNGSPTFYDITWTQVESPEKGAVQFTKYVTRKKPSSSMQRAGGTGVPVRDLDFHLQVKYDVTEPHTPGVCMEKQLNRDEAVLARRDVCRKTWMEEALPLRVKYGVVDINRDTAPSFDKQLTRDQMHTAINERRRRNPNRKSESEVVDIHKSFAATKARVKGHVSMSRSAPRFAKPGSRVMVGCQPETVERAVYLVTKEEKEHQEQLQQQAAERKRRIAKQGSFNKETKPREKLRKPSQQAEQATAESPVPASQMSMSSGGTASGGQGDAEDASEASGPISRKGSTKVTDW
eukprot:TRINITY_DN61900_c0_g2_i1.p1 TRINITY_DN61900_c0_g2~~TRINITY_DN61900_c0_g2_i1.p1  ORF type:complete len:579 (+),score=40.05 TRINITY_DN61900_c0_g2_i1:211-1947(+)